jgi:hypothetical protein
LTDKPKVELYLAAPGAEELVALYEELSGTTFSESERAEFLTELQDALTPAKA